MQRRDYILLARVFADTRPRSNLEINSAETTAILYMQWAKDVIALCDMIEAGNSRFDRQLFQYACTGNREDVLDILSR